MTISEYLLKAIESGEVLNIIYHGGSKPGGMRTIIPRSAGGGALRAVDVETNRVKSFSIKKIEILDEKNEIIKFDIDEKKIEEFQSLTIERIYELYKDTLEGFGWQAFLENGMDDYWNEITYITLYDSFKNGKPRAHPSVYIYQTKSKYKPFGVGSVRMETRTYSSLKKALTVFLEEAQNCEIKNQEK
jgi:hypothetical protein